MHGVYVAHPRERRECRSGFVPIDLNPQSTPLCLWSTVLFRGRTDPDIQVSAQYFLLGAVFAKVVLVQGVCYLIGGILHGKQPVDHPSTKASMTILVWALFMASLPAIFALTTSRSLTGQATETGLQRVSNWAGVFCLLSFIFYVVFKVKSNPELFREVKVCFRFCPSMFQFGCGRSAARAVGVLSFDPIISLAHVGHFEFPEHITVETQYPRRIHLPVCAHGGHVSQCLLPRANHPRCR